MIINISLLGIGLILESALIKLNWVGRKRLKAKELNPIWAFFDNRRLTSLSLVMHFSLVCLLFTYWAMINEISSLLIGLIILYVNVLHDNARIKDILEGIK